MNFLSQWVNLLLSMYVTKAQLQTAGMQKRLFSKFSFTSSQQFHINGLAGKSIRGLPGTAYNARQMTVLSNRQGTSQ